MQRIPRHRARAALLTFLSLIVVAMLPIGVGSAAAASTSCQAGEGGPICYLAISAPQSVVTGQTFIVQVAVTTDESRTVVAKSDPCKNVEVSLLVSDGEGFQPLHVAQTAGGIATFDVIVNNPGPHTLTATASKPGCNYVSDFRQFMAVDIPDDQPIAPCPADVSCFQTTSNSGSAATLFADAGVFSASFVPFVSLNPADVCGGAGPADPNGVLTFVYAGGDPTTTVLALRPDRVTKGIGLYNICWKSVIPFTPRGGGAQVLVGYLPNCKQNDVGPCVLFKHSDQHHAAFFGVLAPFPDPQMYPE